MQVHGKDGYGLGIDMKTEVWKDIPGYEGYYQASTFGRIRSVDRIVGYKIKGMMKHLRGDIKVPKTRPNGYLEVSLYKHHKPKTLQVHRLVAMTFLPNRESKPQVNHIDGNPGNNNVSNLEWATASENIGHCRYILHKAVTPVIQYDLDGNFIARYDCIKHASEATGMKGCGISNAAGGRRKTCGHYIWKYEKGRTYSRAKKVRTEGEVL